MITERAAEALRRERARRLRELSPQRSLEIYLALWEEFGQRKRGVSEFVLITRRAFAKRSGAEGSQNP